MCIITLIIMPHRFPGHMTHIHSGSVPQVSTAFKHSVLRLFTFHPSDNCVAGSHLVFNLHFPDYKKVEHIFTDPLTIWNYFLVNYLFKPLSIFFKIVLSFSKMFSIGFLYDLVFCWLYPLQIYFPLFGLSSLWNIF